MQCCRELYILLKTIYIVAENLFGVGHTGTTDDASCSTANQLHSEIANGLNCNFVKFDLAV